MTAAPDFGHLEPMLDATQRELRSAGVTDTPGVLLADAGYWHHQQMERIVDPRDRGADPAGCEQAQGRPAGLGRWPLRVHASRARARARRRALPATPADDRAGVRPDQAQPRDRTVPAKRPSRRARGMAPDHRHPQSPDRPPSPAPATPDRTRPPRPAPRPAA